MLYDWNTESIPMISWEQLVPLYVIRGGIDDSLLSDDDNEIFDKLETEEEFIIPYLLIK